MHPNPFSAVNLHELNYMDCQPQIVTVMSQQSSKGASRTPESILQALRFPIAWRRAQVFDSSLCAVQSISRTYAHTWSQQVGLSVIEQP